jgi:hypothetical protein
MFAPEYALVRRQHQKHTKKVNMFAPEHPQTLVNTGLFGGDYFQISSNFLLQTYLLKMFGVEHASNT